MSGSTDTVCQALEVAGISNLVSLPGDTTYRDITEGYWSRVAHKQPWCIVRPTTAEEVSRALKAIIAISECKFAVRGGGHNLWGAGSIHDGVLIDMSAMNTTTYDPSTGIASIQAGSRWGDAYEVLESHGVIVGGGRESDVSVAGLTIGGGISWYSPRLGLVCDQVKNFEVVLASGEITNANQTENADLWLALKGGASNFGVVTRLDMYTIPVDPIWGGYLVSDKSTTAAHLRAFTNFVANNGKHPDSSYVVLWNYVKSAGDTVIARFLVNTKGVENPPELEESLAIPTLVQVTKKTTLTQLTREFSQPHGSFNFWYTATVKNDPNLLQKAVDLHGDMVQKLQSASSTGEFSTICFFQAVPTVLSEHGRARGGNSTGIDRLRDDNAVLFVAGANTTDPELSGLAGELTARFCADFKTYAESVGGLLPWIHGNHADGSQNPYCEKYNSNNSEIGMENLEKLRTAAKKYDPSGVFQTRVPGGHKLY